MDSVIFHVPKGTDTKFGGATARTGPPAYEIPLRDQSLSKCARLCAWLRIGPAQDNKHIRSAMRSEDRARAAAIEARVKHLGGVRAALAEVDGRGWERRLSSQADASHMREALRVLRTWPCRLGSVSNTRFSDAASALRTWQVYRKHMEAQSLATQEASPSVPLAPGRWSSLARAATIRALDTAGVQDREGRGRALGLMDHFIRGRDSTQNLFVGDLVAKANALAAQQAQLAGTWQQRGYLSHPPYREWREPASAVEAMASNPRDSRMVLDWLIEVRQSVLDAFGCNANPQHLRAVLARAQGLGQDAAAAASLLVDDFVTLSEGRTVAETNAKFASLLRVLQALDVQAFAIEETAGTVSAEQAPEFARRCLAELFVQFGIPANDTRRSEAATQLARALLQPATGATVDTGTLKRLAQGALSRRLTLQQVASALPA